LTGSSFGGGSVQPDLGRTSKTGNGTSFSVYQPTLYLGNVFIYAGVNVTGSDALTTSVPTNNPTFEPSMRPSYEPTKILLM